MNQHDRRLIHKAGYLAMGVLLMPLFASGAHADAKQAQEIFKKMSDYVSAQKVISFKYDSNLDIVTKDGQRLGLASSGTIEINRPDMIRATRTGGFADVEGVFDGKTFTIFGKNLNLYAQSQIPGTIDNLVDQLRDKFGRPLPAADLLLSDPYGSIMPEVKDVKDLGYGVIRGGMCDHLAFRTEDVDLQIWVATGAEPYPCRYILTSRGVEGGPAYTIDVRDWKAGGAASPADFAFQPPTGATLVKIEEITDADELPSQFTPAK